MNLKDCIVGLASYGKNVAAPQIEDTGLRAFFYGCACAMGYKAEYVAKENAPLLRRIGIVDAEGVVDLDMLEKVGYETFEAIPQVTYRGFTFRREDFTDFLNHLKGIVK